MKFQLLKKKMTKEVKEVKEESSTKKKLVLSGERDKTDSEIPVNTIELYNKDKTSHLMTIELTGKMKRWSTIRRVDHKERKGVEPIPKPLGGCKRSLQQFIRWFLAPMLAEFIADMGEKNARILIEEIMHKELKKNALNITNFNDVLKAWNKAFPNEQYELLKDPKKSEASKKRQEKRMKELERKKAKIEKELAKLVS